MKIGRRTELPFCRKLFIFGKFGLRITLRNGSILLFFFFLVGGFSFRFL